MPKISDDRKLERSRQILDAARRCFAEKGFHRASMSDVIKESGLSAGAVYSYYSSKEELIAAVARSMFVAYEAGIHSFDDPQAHPASPEAAVRALAERILLEIAPLTDGFRMVLTVWGEAANNPALRDTVRDIVRGLRGVFERVLTDWQSAGHTLPAEPAVLAQVMVSVMQGVVVQQGLVGDIEVEDYIDAFCAVLRGVGLGEPRP
jgi:AcrR family transcriptional regulator